MHTWLRITLLALFTCIACRRACCRLEYAPAASDPGREWQPFLLANQPTARPPAAPASLASSRPTQPIVVSLSRSGAARSARLKIDLSLEECRHRREPLDVAASAAIRIESMKRAAKAPATTRRPRDTAAEPAPNFSQRRPYRASLPTH